MSHSNSKFNEMFAEALRTGRKLDITQPWGDASGVHEGVTVTSIEWDGPRGFQVLPRDSNHELYFTDTKITDVKWSSKSADEVRSSLIAAIKSGSEVEIDYTDLMGEKSTRVVKPSSLCIEGASESIGAYCKLRQLTRSFRLDGIADVREAPKPEPTFKIGDRIRLHEAFETVYILASAGYRSVIAIDPETGGRWAEAVAVGQPSKITATEVTKITNGKPWTLVTR